MKTRIQMMRRRSSRRWSMTDMRPSGLDRRRRMLRATLATSVPRLDHALLGRSHLDLQLGQVSRQLLQLREVGAQPLALPGQLIGTERDHDRCEHGRADPHEKHDHSIAPHASLCTPQPYVASYAASAWAASDRMDSASQPGDSTATWPPDPSTRARTHAGSETRRLICSPSGSSVTSSDG